jgi:hypothetical protein
MYAGNQRLCTTFAQYLSAWVMRYVTACFITHVCFTKHHEKNAKKVVILTVLQQHLAFALGKQNYNTRTAGTTYTDLFYNGVHGQPKVVQYTRTISPAAVRYTKGTKGARSRAEHLSSRTELKRAFSQKCFPRCTSCIGSHQGPYALNIRRTSALHWVAGCSCKR